MHRCLNRIAVGAATLGLFAVVAACGSSSPDMQSPPTKAIPSSTAPTSTIPPSSTTQPAARTSLMVYFLRSGKIDVAHRTVAATIRLATVAMTELLAGPSGDDQAAGLATAVPMGTRLLGINIASGVATVDLSGTFASGGGSLSMTGRLAQVTYTLTQFPTVRGVVFHLDGRSVTAFGGEGIVLDHPATRADFESLTPAILLEYPGRGWAVQSPLRIAGTANVFEAQFQAEISDSNGRIVAQQTIHATSGTGARGTFDTSISFPASASGPATVTVFDTSAKDGTRIDVVKVLVNLSGA